MPLLVCLTVNSWLFTKSAPVCFSKNLSFSIRAFVDELRVQLK